MERTPRLEKSKQTRYKEILDQVEQETDQQESQEPLRTYRTSIHDPGLNQPASKPPIERIPNPMLSDNPVQQYQMEEIFKWYVSGGMSGNRRCSPRQMAESLDLTMPKFSELLGVVQSRLGYQFKGAKLLDTVSQLTEVSLAMTLEDRALSMEFFHELRASGENKAAVSALNAASAARKGLDKFVELALKQKEEEKDNNVTINLPAFMIRKGRESGMVKAVYDTNKQRSEIEISYPDDTQEYDVETD